MRCCCQALVTHRPASWLDWSRTPLATVVAHVAYGTIVGGFISLAS
jgi:hypothetical protein